MVQKKKIWPCRQNVLENWTHEIRSQIPITKPDLVLMKKKLRNCQLVDFAVQAGHILKISEKEKIDKYLDRELK